MYIGQLEEKYNHLAIDVTLKGLMEKYVDKKGFKIIQWQWALKVPYDEIIQSKKNSEIPFYKDEEYNLVPADEIGSDVLHMRISLLPKEKMVPHYNIVANFREFFTNCGLLIMTNLSRNSEVLEFQLNLGMCLTRNFEYGGLLISHASSFFNSKVNLLSQYNFQRLFRVYNPHSERDIEIYGVILSELRGV